MRHLLLLPIVLAGCTQEPQNAAEITTGNASDSASDFADAAPAAVNSNEPLPRTRKTAAVGPLALSYDPSLLTSLPAKIAIPPDWKIEVDGLKLLARDRAGLIGRAECIYGQSDTASLCNVQQEAGLSFAALAIPFAKLSRRLPSGQRQDIELAGVRGVSWQIGAEGEGAEYILLPIKQGTMLIVRQFRTAGNPDEAALGQVLAGLRFG